MPTTDDVQRWTAREMAKLEAELAGYRDGSTQAWASRRIAELEAENTDLRAIIAGPLTESGRSAARVVRAEALIATGRKRKRKKLSAATRWEVMERDDHHCVYCGADPDCAVLVIDHVIPFIDGGSDDASNLVTACEECNDGKGDRIPVARVVS